MAPFVRALTYFNQHEVTKVAKTADGWTITFGNGKIVNHDAAVPQPEVAKSQLTGVDYEYGDNSTTRLLFSNGVSVELTPTEYSVDHPACGLCWPERDQEQEDTVPDDPSALRVAEGPTGPEEE